MAAVYPIMWLSAINIAMFAAVFVKIMVDTNSGKGLDEQEKTSDALFCMLGLGSAEIISSMVFGRL